MAPTSISTSASSTTTTTILLNNNEGPSSSSSSFLSLPFSSPSSSIINNNNDPMGVNYYRNYHNQQQQQHNNEQYHSAIVTCYHSVVDSHSLLISLLLITIIISLISFYFIYNLKRFFQKNFEEIYDEEEDLEGLEGVVRGKHSFEEDLYDKTIVLTGANNTNGIGGKLAKILARKGARLILLCRDLEKGRKILDEIKKKNPIADIIIHHIDLSSMTSIRVCCNEILNQETRIDYLINCASIAFLPGNEPTKSIDGYELHMAINYYGHFLLIHLLHDKMKQTAQNFKTTTKVINVSSLIHRFGKIHWLDLNLDKSYTPFKAYSQSKLALIFATRQMAKNWKSTGVHFYSVEPGLAWTETHYQNLYGICQNFLKYFGFLIGFHSTQSAARKILFVVLNKRITKQNGYHYRNGRRSNPNSLVYDEKLSQQLWNHTINVCNL